MSEVNGEYMTKDMIEDRDARLLQSLTKGKTKPPKVSKEEYEKMLLEGD